MPLVTFYLDTDSLAPGKGEQLLRAASELYSSALAAPIERVRAMIMPLQNGLSMAGGAAAMTCAPLFEFVVMQGRPLEQRQALAAGFTTLLAELPGVDPGQVRGRCIQVAPEDWFIGGVAASVVRAGEVAARAAVMRSGEDQ